MELPKLRSMVQKCYWRVSVTALATDKIRISVYLESTLKEWVEEESKKRNRSMSNYIETILSLIKEGKVTVEDRDI